MHEHAHVTCHMHGQDMLSACYQEYNITPFMLCMCSSYEGVVTSELTFLIPIYYVWVGGVCNWPPLISQFFLKIGQNYKKMYFGNMHTTHAHVIHMLCA